MELKSKHGNENECIVWLLIEPYGIEIHELLLRGAGVVAFNRTLWN